MYISKLYAKSDRLLADRTAFAAPACSSPDSRATVIVGDVNSGVTNYSTSGGHTINDLLGDQQEWPDQRGFVNHVSRITARLVSAGTLKASERARLLQAAVRSEIGKYRQVRILVINDFHGNLQEPASMLRVVGADGQLQQVPAGGVEYLATHLYQRRVAQPYTIVVAAGDNIGASPLLSALFHDEPTIEALNLLGVELSAVGNHEFDEGVAELRRLQSGGRHPQEGDRDGDPFYGARFRFLAANVIDRATGQPLFPPYVIKTFGGIRIAFIGLTLKNTPAIVMPSSVAGLEFRDEADTLNRLVGELKRQGVETVVVLLHEGGTDTTPYRLDDCTQLSGPVLDIVNRTDDEVDVFLTAHTHQAYRCRIGHQWVSSALSFGRLFSDLTLKLDTLSGEVVAVTTENVIVTRDVPRDPALSALLAKYTAIATPLERRPIGTVTATLSRSVNAAGESVLGEVIADARLVATQAPTNGGAVVAFVNPGGIRSDLHFAASPAGEGDGVVTYGEAFTVQPFGNSLVTLTLSGAQLRALLIQQFPGCGQEPGNPRLLQVSRGFEYAWDNHQVVYSAGSPQRVLDCHRVIVADSLKLNGLPVRAAADYRVTVDSYLADGGDGFSVLTQGRERLGGAQDVDALAAYFSAHSPVTPGPLNRIRRLGGE